MLPSLPGPPVRTRSLPLGGAGPGRAVVAAAGPGASRHRRGLVRMGGDRPDDRVRAGPPPARNLGLPAPGHRHHPASRRRSLCRLRAAGLAIGQRSSVRPDPPVRPPVRQSSRSGEHPRRCWRGQGGNWRALAHWRSLTPAGHRGSELMICMAREHGAGMPQPPGEIPLPQRRAQAPCDISTRSIEYVFAHWARRGKYDGPRSPPIVERAGGPVAHLLADDQCSAGAPSATGRRRRRSLTSNSDQQCLTAQSVFRTVPRRGDVGGADGDLLDGGDRRGG
jgi:hypothetical protein